MVSNPFESTEVTMVAAHKAGMEYWRRNKPYDATRKNIESLAHTLGWHEAENECFVAGFLQQRKRDKEAMNFLVNGR